jgi:hypothetical protein
MSKKPYDRTVQRLREIERIGVPLATIDAHPYSAMLRRNERKVFKAPLA